MSKSIEPADRRPLIYGVFVLLILVAASYLFWPRTPHSDSLVLTPESVRTGSAAAEMSGALTEAPHGDAVGDVADADLETTAVDESHAIAAETSISDEAPVTRAVTPEPTRREPTRVEPVRTTALAGTGPASSGDWVLNVGAFSAEASARARAEEISREGMSAHVHSVVSNGNTLWRVRVGYFATKAKADEYGQWMKSTHGIEGWASAR